MKAKIRKNLLSEQKFASRNGFLRGCYCFAAGRLAAPNLHRALPRRSATASSPNLTAAGRFASLRLCRGLLWRMVLAELYIINVKMGKMVKSAIFLKKKWEIFCGMKKCS